MRKSVRRYNERVEAERDERSWTTLLIHEGSENTPEIENVCRDSDISVKYDFIKLERFGTFERVQVFTTIDGFNKLISTLKDKKLCSDQGYWLGV